MGKLADEKDPFFTLPKRPSLPPFYHPPLSVAPLATVAATCRRLRREGVGRGGAAVADKCCGNVRQGCYSLTKIDWIK